MTKKNRSIFNIFIVVFIGVLISYFFKKKDALNNIRDYQDIVNSGEVNIVTSYNGIDYYIEGDTIKGFQYEMIHHIFHNKNIKYNITPVSSLNEQIEDIEKGKYDILASNIIATKEIKESLNLTVPILTNRQVLVQRKDSTYISNQLDLAKKTVHVVKNSPSIFRINNLSNEIADTIFIEELDKYGQEALIALVAHNDIDYAVCDEIVAKFEASHINNIDVSLAIGFTQFYSWGVHKKAPKLLDSLNVWIEDYLNSKEYKELYAKYYH